MKKSIVFALIGTLVILFGACNNKSKKQKEEAKNDVVAQEACKSKPVKEVFVTEEWVYTVPVITPSKTEPVKTQPANPSGTTGDTRKDNNVANGSSYIKIGTKDLDNSLSVNNIQQTKKEEAVSCFCFDSETLNTTKIITSYSKNGKETMKVVSNPTNPDVIDYIVFTDKNDNTDVYGVNVGLTGKEARHLRRDIKHFEKKGKVFLFQEDSNIVYEMDCVTAEGKPITETEIDNARVTAIIWKDKADRPHVAIREKK